MAETITHTLPHGITLHCRVAGMPGRPVLLFLHGFPEGAFIWDALLGHFADPAHGGYRCVAPWLRGYAPSSAPAAIEAYRPKHLVQDIAALIAQEAGAGTPLAANASWPPTAHVACSCTPVLTRLPPPSGCATSANGTSSAGVVGSPSATT